MSWGYKILLAYALFFVMIITFLYIASQQTNEMLETNYYEKEIQFQKILNGSDNLNVLNESINLKLTSEQLEINFPKEGIKDQPLIHLEFIKMSDQSKDFNLDLKTNENGQIIIPTEKFSKGYYRLQMQWESNGKPYVYRDQFKFLEA
ncbi:MAG: FixH family protein [Saprospiraceae bacterium]|nr:FixH family protein [Saprospiraceae bacterium]MBK7738678.1 FixH family protein [Saprospiraceae bacterium]MBK7912750.1 FixH family protein [Saprospiraceae bacterium]